jgi:biopolymer transport protein ExbD
MLVHPKRRAHIGVQVPLTSLIDIVFLLLIYFLLTTNFMVEEGIKVKLPDRQGRAFLGTREVSMPALFDGLKEMIGDGEDKLVVVRADRAVILNKAVKVMDVVKAAGAGRLCLATEKEF